MIKALAKDHSWQDALHAVQWRCFSTDAKKTTALGACSRAKQWALLCLLHDDALPNVIFRNVAINALDRVSHWQRCFDALSEFAVITLEPDKISFGSALSACSKSNQWNCVLNLFRTCQGLESKVQSSVSYNVVVTACAKQREWRGALTILSNYQQSRLPLVGVDKALITSAMRSCGERAWELMLTGMQELVDGTVRVDVVMLTSLIDVCSSWSVSQKVLSNMCLSSLPPDNIVLAAAVRSMNLWEKALHQLTCAISLSLADAATFNAAMNACAVYKEESSMALFKSMRKLRVQANAVSFKALALSVENWELSLSILSYVPTYGVKLEGLESSSAGLSQLLAPDGFHVESSRWMCALHLVSRETRRGGQLSSSWHLRNWALALQLNQRDSPDSISEKVMKESCDSLGWQWSLSAMAARDGGRLKALAFVHGGKWESAILCLEQLFLWLGHKTSV